MGDFLKYGHHPTVIVFPTMTKVVQLPENGGMSHVFENLLMKAFQNI
jgi:hypothetical protein